MAQIPQGYEVITAPLITDGVNIPQGYEAVEPQQEETSVADDLMRQVGLTGRIAAEGVAGTVGLVADPFADAARRIINLALEDKIPQSSFENLIGGLLTDAGVPEPETKTEMITNRVLKAVVGGGAGAAAAKGIAAGTKGVTSAVAEQLAAQPTAQIVGAGAGQASSEAVREAGGGEAAQLAASLVGGVAGAGLTSKLSTAKTVAPQITDDIAATEKQGIRVLTSDVKTPETFAAKWAQSTGEKIPVVGTGPVRSAQQAERVSAIKNTLREFGAEDAANLSDDVMDDLLRTRSKKLTSLTTAKNQVFDALDDAGVVPVERTTARLTEEIDNLKTLGGEGSKILVSFLDDMKATIQGKSINQVEQLRKRAGEALSKNEGLAHIRGEGQKIMKGVYSALKEDMGEFIQTNGSKQDHTKWQVVNKQLSNMINELDKSTLKTALNKGSVTPEVVNSLLLSKKPSDMRSLYKNLSGKGRATARAAILNEAAEKSMTGGEISPQKFMTYLSKNNDRFGIFFKGDNLKQIKGLERALELTKQASVSGVSPPTGQQLAIPVGAAVLADLLGSGGAAIASGGAIGGLARAYESKPVRDALIALSHTKIGTKEEAAIMKRLIASAQTYKRNQEQK
jgi:hypothetical protein